MFKYLSMQSLENLNQVEPSLAVDMLSIFQQEYAMQKQQIDDSLLNKNYIEFAKKIHALKGAISVFGCDEICKNLKTIELQAKSNEVDPALQLYQQLQKPLEDVLIEVQRYLDKQSLVKEAS